MAWWEWWKLFVPSDPYPVGAAPETRQESHFAYHNAYFTCGYCGWLMHPEPQFPEGQPIIRIVYCNNNRCPHEGKRYKVPREAGVELVPID